LKTAEKRYELIDRTGSSIPLPSGLLVGANQIDQADSGFRLSQSQIYGISDYFSLSIVQVLANGPTLSNHEQYGGYFSIPLNRNICLSWEVVLYDYFQLYLVCGYSLLNKLGHRKSDYWHHMPL